MVIMSSKHLNAQYNLRWPNDLKEKIAQSAKEHNRSMNADIIARLESSFNNFPNHSIESLEAFKAHMDDQNTRLMKQYELLVEQNKKQEALLLELQDFQEWRKLKKPT